MRVHPHCIYSVRLYWRLSSCSHCTCIAFAFHLHLDLCNVCTALAAPQMFHDCIYICTCICTCLCNAFSFHLHLRCICIGFRICIHFPSAFQYQQGIRLTSCLAGPTCLAELEGFVRHRFAKPPYHRCGSSPKMPYTRRLSCLPTGK